MTVPVPTPTAVAVVVPARNEEELLPACLDSIEAAVDALQAVHGEIRVRTFVVLDACTDGSAEVVAGRPGVTAVTTRAGCVGVARARGIEAATTWAEDVEPRSLWLANTDADSTVPRDWLVAQVRRAGGGCELVVGTVEPRRGDLSPAALTAWRERHSTADGHEHVHGANLGFSLRSYLFVGGFAPLSAHEDVELVTAMRNAGTSWVATGEAPVTTSGRRSGRTPEGFATYLEDLGA